MSPRFRVRFTGPVAPGIVAWLKLLIPVLREIPEGIEVTVEIESAPEAETDPRRDETG